MSDKPQPQNLPPSLSAEIVRSPEQPYGRIIAALVEGNDARGIFMFSPESGIPELIGCHLPAQCYPDTNEPAQILILWKNGRVVVVSPYNRNSSHFRSFAAPAPSVCLQALTPTDAQEVFLAPVSNGHCSVVDSASPDVDPEQLDKAIQDAAGIVAEHRAQRAAMVGQVVSSFSSLLEEPAAKADDA